IGIDGPQRRLTVSNMGAASSGRLGVEKAGANADDVLIVRDTCHDAALTPGGSCTIDVRLHAAESGDKAATLTVSASPRGSTVATRTGRALRTGVLAVTPAQVELDAALVGARGAAHGLTVRNTSETATTVSVSLFRGDDVAIADNQCTGTLAGLATCSVSVTLAPQRA